MDVRRQILVVRRWFPFLVLSVLLAAGAALVVSNLQDKVYEAKATLIVGQSLSAVNPDYSQLLVSQTLSTTYATVATKRPMLENVIEQLALGMTPDELARNVRADAPFDSTLVIISAQDTDPSQAAVIANALAEQLIAASPVIQGREAEFQASIDANRAATQDQIDVTQARAAALSRLLARTPAQETDLQALEDRLASLRATYAALLSFSATNASNLLSIIEPAVPPASPISPRPLLNTLVGALIGLVVAAGVISIAEHLDDKVKNPDVVEEVTNLSTLGTIARMKGDRGRRELYRLATLLHPRSSVAEDYRTLRANIEFASVAQPIRTLLVTSSVPDEGKTVTAANLAVVFAQAGRQTLLVDADLRKPGVHAIFGIANTDGLTTLLRSDEVSLDAIAQPTEQADLRILTTGPIPPNPAELLGSERMREVVHRLTAASDLVIFDSPPLGAFTDAAILSSVLDGSLLVIDAERSRRRSVRLGREALARAGSNVLGAVLNRASARAQANYADWAYQVDASR